MMDKTKYSYLIEQYKDTIYNYALYMMGNRMDADDVAQEVFIKIWKNISGFNILAAKAWIMRTTHNLCIDYLRRRKKNVENESDLENDNLKEIADRNYANKPDKLAEFNQGETEIKAAIKSLPDSLKSIFVLYELEGMKYREISKTLEIPINTVKVYLLRARKKLQKKLRAYYIKDAI